MDAFIFRSVVVAALALGAVGCGHSHGHSGGSSFPSHSGGSSSSSHSSWSGSGSGSHSSGSGSSHSSNTSYYGTHPSGSHASASPPPQTRKGSSGDADTAGKIVQAVAAGLINAAGSALDEGGGNDRPPRTRPESPCEAQLREWREIHTDVYAKVPPQLRCGPNGEWGGEPVATQNR